MAFAERLVLWSRIAFYFGNNWISLLGVVLTTSSGFTLIGFWGLELVSARPVHPYAGILLFLILPGVFVAGLALMPLGALWRRAQLRRAGATVAAYPRIDLHEPHVRHGLTFVGAATVLNVVMLGTATFKGVEYMDSTQFCGLTCHQVMAPEYTAFLDSPHSRVGCVQCHIGPGASWFVKSKLSGVRQVFAVAFDTHSRPIPSPVHDLRPARETCEQCHWPAKFHGDKFLVRTKFTPDEKNTPATTVLVLKVGGRGSRGSVGIHGRHFDDMERVSYVTTDSRRQIIPRVTYRDDDGKTVEYVSEDVKPSATDLATAEERAMDCIDCHNQPSHTFELPERAVDRAMGEGRISPDLPFAKKEAVELLRRDYPDRDTAKRQIGEAWAEFYRTQYAEVYKEHRALVESSGAAVQAIYLRNVFPDMKVTWGTHPNHVGHEDFLGCFRCHDENHKSKDGRTITQDCNACHTLLAQDETNPKVLADLGLQP